MFWLDRCAALREASLGDGGCKTAFTKTSRASSCRVRSSKSLIVSAAACWALATTNSVTEEPRKAAARAIIFFCSGVTRASKRSSFRERRSMTAACLTVSSQTLSIVYGESPDKSITRYGQEAYSLSELLTYCKSLTIGYISKDQQSDRQQLLSFSCFLHTRPRRKTRFSNEVHRRGPPVVPIAVLGSRVERTRSQR